MIAEFFSKSLYPPLNQRQKKYCLYWDIEFKTLKKKKLLNKSHKELLLISIVMLSVLYPQIVHQKDIPCIAVIAEILMLIIIKKPSDINGASGKLFLKLL